MRHFIDSLKGALILIWMTGAHRTLAPLLLVLMVISFAFGYLVRSLL